MPAYRRKLEIIDAMQFTDADSANAITLWSKGLITAAPVLDITDQNPTGLYMEFAGGQVIVGEWIVARPGDLFEVFAPGLFEATYVEGDAQNDLPKTRTNPFGLERRKADIGPKERRGLIGRSNEGLRLQVAQLTEEKARLTERINVAVASLQVLKGQA